MDGEPSVMEQFITLCIGFAGGYFVCYKYDNLIHMKWIDFKVNYKKIILRKNRKK
jgi:hypothetical protein